MRFLHSYNPKDYISCCPLSSSQKTYISAEYCPEMKPFPIVFDYEVGFFQGAKSSSEPFE
jgi:hypothetical protein